MTGIEKRRADRVKLSIYADVQTSEGQVISGITKDLSLSGAYVASNLPVVIPSTCDFHIYLSDPSKKHKVSGMGTIVRKDPQGFAIRFETIELSSYEDLCRLVEYNPSETPRV